MSVKTVVCDSERNWSRLGICHSECRQYRKSTTRIILRYNLILKKHKLKQKDQIKLVSKKFTCGINTSNFLMSGCSI